MAKAIVKGTYLWTDEKGETKSYGPSVDDKPIDVPDGLAAFLGVEVEETKPKKAKEDK
jgi:hypothetical protein